MLATVITSFFLNPHPRTCLLNLEKGEGWERGGERNVDIERNTDRLPLVRTLTGN